MTRTQRQVKPGWDGEALERGQGGFPKEEILFRILTDGEDLEILIK